MAATENSQRIITAHGSYEELDQILTEQNIKKILLVCGNSIRFQKINGYLSNLEERLGVSVIRFSGFQPNPKYESVVEGVRVFRESGCDTILAVGGGSAMDVAKCIKLYALMDPDELYLKQKIVPNDIRLWAVPTTAGTGSEATRFAVIYYEGEKQSVTHESCIPSLVILDSAVLSSLPSYQRKATMMDALCHAVESFWSVNSTDKSREYSTAAIKSILRHMDGYLQNEEDGNTGMLLAANTAGKAINITQTTAGHAMCYKLTSLYGISHGHAAALCVSELWPYMTAHLQNCADARGEDFLKTMFTELETVFGCTVPGEAPDRFKDMLKKLELGRPDSVREEDYAILRSSVNPVRLKNNPVFLDEQVIDSLYHRILA